MTLQEALTDYVAEELQAAPDPTETESFTAYLAARKAWVASTVDGLLAVIRAYEETK